MIRNIRLIFLLLIFAVSNVFAATAIINVPAANMHKKPAIDASVISQAIYGMSVDVVKQEKGWTMIGTHDYYSGWVKNSDLVFKSWPKKKQAVEANNLFTAIYQEPDMNMHAPIIIPYSAKLPLIKIMDVKWVEVMLPDGGSGYMRRGDVSIDPKPMTMRQMLKLSRKFVGLSYIWGGNSTFGFDCSGFVQQLYKQMGIILPRDTGLLVKWPGFIKVTKAELRPGDVMLFGYNNVISHAGMYLGGGYFVNSTSFKDSTVKISKLSKPHWTQLFITARRLRTATVAPKFRSSITPIPTKVQQQMRRYTWKDDCPVPMKDLAYVKMSYWGYDNKAHHGVLIVHENLAPQVVAIFQQLYQQRFPIKKMKPMYLYKGNDKAAMRNNDTSAFNCRRQTDFPKLFSPHSYGGAIDINPLINPYDNKGDISPPQGKKYLDRDKPYPGKITNGSSIVNVFAKYGWSWGGNWDKRDIKDYQHFEKNPLQ